MSKVMFEDRFESGNTWHGGTLAEESFSGGQSLRLESGGRKRAAVARKAITATSGRQLVTLSTVLAFVGEPSLFRLSLSFGGHAAVLALVDGTWRVESGSGALDVAPAQPSVSDLLTWRKVSLFADFDRGEWRSVNVSGPNHLITVPHEVVEEAGKPAESRSWNNYAEEVVPHGEWAEILAATHTPDSLNQELRATGGILTLTRPEKPAVVRVDQVPAPLLSVAPHDVFVAEIAVAGGAVLLDAISAEAKS